MDCNDRLTCHRAIQTRDARFDGRLFIGVTSTGIYCRPICPARTPRVENCRFYPSAAAAQQDGFRPRLRCRPESAPGGGTWRGSYDTVSRALALQAESGPSDEPALAAIAARLHISMRQLRRLFQLDDIRRLTEILARVARAFDTATDITVINAHLAADPLLAPLVAARPGLRPPGHWDAFEAAVLTLLPPDAVAALLDLCAPPLPQPLRQPGVTRQFPGAADVLAADLATLPVAPVQRAALLALARTAETQAAPLPDDSDAFACDDPRLAARSIAWQPWRAYAARHLHSQPTVHHEETT